MFINRMLFLIIAVIKEAMINKALNLSGIQISNFHRNVNHKSITSQIKKLISQFKFI